MAKASLHGGRTKNRSAKHNDVSYDIEKNPSVIHPERLSDNLYMAVGSDGELHRVPGGQGRFEQSEKNFYKANFKDGLRARNDRYKEQRHPERAQTMAQFRSGSKSKPYELILQVGKTGDELLDSIDARAFNDLTVGFMQEFSKKYGSSIKILNTATHHHEMTPHSQTNLVFVAPDRDGNLMPNQNQALKDLGFEMPYPDEPPSKTNNLLVSFTSQVREAWYCYVERELGIEIDREVKTPGVKHRNQHEDRTSYVQSLSDELEAEELLESDDINQI